MSRTGATKAAASAFRFPGGGMRFPSGGSAAGGGGIGILGILIILGLMFFFGVDPSVIMQGGGPGGDQGNFPDIQLPQSRPDTTNFPIPGQQQGRRSSIRRPPARTISSASSPSCSADTEDVWRDIFAPVWRAL